MITVSDNGTGIKKEDLPRIFDGFYRGDSARSNIKGNGLGLAISKQIIENHHGKIWAKSEKDEGTQDVYKRQEIHPLKNQARHAVVAPREGRVSRNRL